MSKHDIAIDFGNSRTKVAYLHSRKNEPRLVKWQGERTREILTSLFFLEKNDPDDATLQNDLVPVEVFGKTSLRKVFFGDAAWSRGLEDPIGLVRRVKLDIHHPRPLRVRRGQKVERTDLIKCLFSHIKRYCQEKVFQEDSVSSCTLTVPADYPLEKKAKLKSAAISSGFSECKVMSEPEAAAIHWLREKNQSIGRWIIVCDVGGGTSDFALLGYQDGKFHKHEKIPSSSIENGGMHVDENIWEDFIDSQIDAYGNQFDENEWRKFKDSILQQLRYAREDEPNKVDGTTALRVLNAEINIPWSLIRNKENELNKTIAAEMRRFTEKAIEILPDKDVNSLPILLAGGGSRMSGLKEAITGSVSQNVHVWEDSEFATVLGAVQVPESITKGKGKEVEDAFILKKSKDHQEKNRSMHEPYGQAVAAAWMDKEISKKERQILLDLRKELDLSKSQANETEIDIMGKSLEEVSGDSRLKNQETYKVTLLDFLALKEFSDEQFQKLQALRGKLSLSSETALEIERNVFTGKTLHEFRSNRNAFSHIQQKTKTLVQAPNKSLQNSSNTRGDFDSGKKIVRKLTEARWVRIRFRDSSYLSLLYGKDNSGFLSSIRLLSRPTQYETFEVIAHTRESEAVLIKTVDGNFLSSSATTVNAKANRKVGATPFFVKRNSTGKKLLLDTGLGLFLAPAKSRNESVQLLPKTSGDLIELTWEQAEKPKVSKSQNAQNHSSKRAANKKKKKEAQNAKCPKCRIELKLWNGQMRCWECGWTNPDPNPQPNLKSNQIVDRERVHILSVKRQCYLGMGWAFFSAKPLAAEKKCPQGEEIFEIITFAEDNSQMCIIKTSSGNYLKHSLEEDNELRDEGKSINDASRFKRIEIDKHKSIIALKDFRQRYLSAKGLWGNYYIKADFQATSIAELTASEKFIVYPEGSAPDFSD